MGIDAETARWPGEEDDDYLLRLWKISDEYKRQTEHFDRRIANMKAWDKRPWWKKWVGTLAGQNPYLAKDIEP